MLTEKKQFIFLCNRHTINKIIGTIFYVLIVKQFMKNSANIIGAMFLGMAVGAVIGVLLAPDKGSETRKKITGNAKDLADGLKSRFYLRNNRINSDPEDYLEEYYRNIGLSAGYTKGLA